MSAHGLVVLFLHLKFLTLHHFIGASKSIADVVILIRVVQFIAESNIERKAVRICVVVCVKKLKSEAKRS